MYSSYWNFGKAPRDILNAMIDGGNTAVFTTTKISTLPVPDIWFTHIGATVYDNPVFSFLLTVCAARTSTNAIVLLLMVLARTRTLVSPVDGSREFLLRFADDFDVHA